MSFGKPHHHFDSIDSTNTRARELAAEGAEHGTIVTADEQTAGRGRQGRVWSAPSGKALLYSAIVRPLDERHLMLPLAAPLAVCEAAEELAGDLAQDGETVTGFRCGVKWPNDVQIGGRKLAGVLIEARPQDGWAVIGIGLNLTIAPEEFPPDLRETAVSIFGSDAGGQGEPRRSLPAVAPTGLPLSPRVGAEVLNRHLAHWVEEDAGTVLAAWRERDALRGREVAWDGGSGVADGVDDRGYLLVRTPAGDRIAVGAGEIHLTRA
jgi:BirA family transcriptional regulator, biotin operon repressor / biotin---[acetyl-CoA-carboxylase] ligase